MSTPMYDMNSEKAVKKHRFYYHVTSVKNAARIKKGGIKADEEGYIFVFTDNMVARNVAINQCGIMDEYALFRIDSRGITGKVIRDRVAEFTAPYHRIIIQDKIHKKYVQFWASLIVDFSEPDEWDIRVMMRMEGLTRADAIKTHRERFADWKKGGK